MINIGINDQQRQDIAKALSTVLADSYLLYIKTHNFHWNVTGPMFSTLHLMFEQQYTELALAVDEIAERIRALGHPAPGSYKQFNELGSIEEEVGVPEAEVMIKQLLQGQETVIRSARAAAAIAAEADDDASADIMTQRIQSHEKTAWMLRSLLG